MFERIGIAHFILRPNHREVSELNRARLVRLASIHAKAQCGSTPNCLACPLISLCESGLAAARQSSPSGKVIVDVFSGAGSLSAGFRAEGYSILLAIEKSKAAAQTYRFNHPGVPVLEVDARRVTPGDVLAVTGKRRGSIFGIVGGPPCQGYSAAGARRPNRKQNLLYKVLIRIAQGTGARIVVMENVPGLKQVNGVKFESSILKDFRQSGYKATAVQLDASLYGVPQKRNRLIFYGVKDAKVNPLSLAPKGRRTNASVEMALRGLPPLKPGEGGDLFIRNGVKILNHKAMAHGPAVIRKIRRIPPGKGPISYKRLQNSLAHTIIAGHRAMPVHPREHRTITVREAARLQTLPDSFRFLGAPAEQPLQVANAVPFKLARALARAVNRRFTHN